VGVPGNAVRLLGNAVDSPYQGDHASLSRRFADIRQQSLAVRQSEIVASLSLVADIGMGQPMGQAQKTCLLALGIAREMGLADQDAKDVYYLALLRFIGCNAHAATDAAMTGGNEMTFRRGMATVISGSQVDAMSHMVRHLGEGLPVTTRVGLVAGAFAAGPKFARDTIAASCEVARIIATRLGLGPSLVRALGYAGEYWNGKGMPDGVSAEEIPIAARVVNVARDVDVLNRVGGRSLTEEVLRKRRGQAYDPAVADAFIQHAWPIWEGIGEESVWDQVIEADPASSLPLTSDRLTAALECCADLADIKCWFTRAHSAAVSSIARDAAKRLSFNSNEVDTIAAAGLVQELGKTGVPNGVLENPQALTQSQWESIRLTTYLTHMILARCQGLEPVNDLACAHHERLDGSGYHRGIGGDQISPGARILAAADAFRAMTTERPWRPGMTPDEAAQRLGANVKEGKLSHDAVDAVLAAAGHADQLPKQMWPAGLSDREVDVLRLISLGRSNREVAQKLFISPKTVGRHIENIYGKIGIGTRPAATLFAMQHHLLP
jgi:HD-GYP domain-containing protein (c-di-GMP phosphodiesterase class II)/DNA-binding CsgD family transcriptional regulator